MDPVSNGRCLNNIHQRRQLWPLNEGAPVRHLNECAVNARSEGSKWFAMGGHGECKGALSHTTVDNYGESILLSPQDSGVSLLVWILPIVVVALGATGIVFALRRNRDQPHLRATEADERLVQREHGDG